ncbi:MFS transporter [Thermomonospora cellulosilytica]|uniref:Putative MFS family arabinose efflux permease n=1 Tax=Thermomonospora cellulosilytica TaxID=1411118 RepID=A0A7W3N304_9ACTN|nr:MFS transporter [Thermomonospora cellulosilytica]MBA9006590.1 putative MFS family arabinose efflux permease [Thermomonospora cellulosilytica]
MPFWLLGLLFAAFVFYTDDHVIAGVLPEIAAGLHVSEAAAGQLVTAFSLTVAVGAPVAAVVVARWPRRTVFAVALAVFTALWPLRPVPLWSIAPLSVLWGGAAFWNSPAIQARLFRLAGPVAPQALALSTSTAHVGVAVGGALGGGLLSLWPIASLPPVSAVLGVAGLAVFTLAVAMSRRRSPAVA